MKIVQKRKHSIKELLNIEKWAYINNIYVHPQYIAAQKEREFLIIQLTFIATMILSTTALIIAETI